MSDFQVGIRRVQELDPGAPLPESDPELVERIRAEIVADGPITFARFMALALYDPERGYYMRPDTEQGPGRRGDFLTAPEGHPLYGWSIARFLEAAWDALDRPARYVIREHGAGTGALAAGILDGLRRSGSPLFDAVEYQAVDIAPARRDALEARLHAAGLGHRLRPADEVPAPGAAIANELLDALPVHRVEGDLDGRLLERFVTLGTGGLAFETILAPASTPALGARLVREGISLEPGQAAEICLALDAWVANALAPLERGVCLLIDYGYPAGELYTASRGSTLRAYQGHRVHADPFVAIGRQDLTAHVDLTAVEHAAAAAGLRSVGRTTQGRFLADLGAGELLVGMQTAPDTTFESYATARAALVRMLDPRATGAFAVLAFARGMPRNVHLPSFAPAPSGTASASEATTRPDR